MRPYLAVICLILVSSCGGGDGDGGVEPPTTGTLEIRTSTFGDPPLAGYTFTLDGGPNNPIGPNATLTLSDLEPGSHVVQLGNLPPNCTTPANPQTVSVKAGSTTVVTFAVTCTAPPVETGTLVITVTTTGNDPDGYQVSVDGGVAQPISVSSTLTILNIPAGNHSVELSDLDGTCAVSGTNPATTTVTSGQTATVTFTVNCPIGQPTNRPPVARFDAPDCTEDSPCTFRSRSTDPDGRITQTHWTFGDGGEADGIEVSHTYETAGTFEVTLRVTDDDGATGSVTHSVTVSRPPGTACTTSGTFVTCPLRILLPSTVEITLTDENCELGGNQFRINDPARARQVIFFNGCSEVDGTTYLVDDATGAPIVFEAGEEIVTQFRQGTPGPGEPAPGSPAILLEGEYPRWTLRIEDGTGEQDFADMVLTVQATP